MAYRPPSFAEPSGGGVGYKSTIASTQSRSSSTGIETAADYRTKLYHGTQAYVIFTYHNKGFSYPTQTAGFVSKVELIRILNTKTRTFIGMLGEPDINVVTKVEYEGTIKKFVSDTSYDREGSDGTISWVEDFANNLKSDNVNYKNDKWKAANNIGTFFNTIQQSIDSEYGRQGAKAEGLMREFTMSIYTSVGYDRIVTTARRCVVTNYKRSLKSDEFMVDEINFKFKGWDEKFV